MTFEHTARQGTSGRRTPSTRHSPAAPALPDRSGKDLPDEADVVVIGGGLTGLSTAYHTARKGARVVLVEKDKVGSGASGRNGSMCTQGITISPAEARKRYGQERARELCDAFRDAVDVVEELTHTENIDCDFNRSGRLGAVCKPGHFDGLRAKLHGSLRPRRPDGHLHGPCGRRDDGRPPGGQPPAWPRLPQGPVPFYNGTAWFLPFGGAYYQAKDKLR
ncbi:NAD(P)/FAD-dependent oxidoreductase [Streptomyces sp. NPDC015127]|uniref:NAD(P)/FAD-dependent oxidoreductase n=1 Tax=Streptomyces sp. NPDC015127 TaxID=3364939 RepID=UPI0036F9511C